MCASVDTLKTKRLPTVATGPRAESIRRKKVSATAMSCGPFRSK